MDTKQIDKFAAAVASLVSLVDQLRGQVVQPDPEIQQRVEQYLQAGVCLRCGKKKNGKYTRGMDANCYNQTLKEIARGDAVEVDLIRNGRITSAYQQPGRKADRPPASALGVLPELPLAPPVPPTGVTPETIEGAKSRVTSGSKTKGKK